MAETTQGGVVSRDGEIFLALRDKFPLPEWITAGEIYGDPNYASRRIDFVAVNCYRSRGFEIVGVEIKISRADFLREMRDPDKAEQCSRYCDRYFLATDKDIVDPAELPKGWGLMLPRGSKFVIKKQAERRKPEFSLPFLISFFRACLNRDKAAASLEEPSEIAAALERGKTLGREAEKDHHAAIIKSYETLTFKVDEFEKTSGIRIRYGWDYENIGKLVDLLIRGEPSDMLKKFEEIRKDVGNLAGNLDGRIEALREFIKS